MAVKLVATPDLKEPVLVAGWSGIGNVGVLAVDSLRTQLNAEYLGEIEPWEFFYPSGVVIKGGVLTELNFPQSRFYFARRESGDIIFFIGDEQPGEGVSSSPPAKKATAWPAWCWTWPSASIPGWSSPAAPPSPPHTTRSPRRCGRWAPMPGW